MSYFPSKHFARSEFACKCGCGFDTVDYGLVEACDLIRDAFGAPVEVTSGCRCPEYNRAVGGTVRSMHLRGRAADIVVLGVDAREVADFAETLRIGGLGRYDDFTHIDTRHGKSRW